MILIGLKATMSSHCTIIHWWLFIIIFVVNKCCWHNTNILIHMWHVPHTTTEPWYPLPLQINPRITDPKRSPIIPFHVAAALHNDSAINGNPIGISTDWCLYCYVIGLFIDLPKAFDKDWRPSRSFMLLQHVVLFIARFIVELHQKK